MGASRERKKRTEAKDLGNVKTNKREAEEAKKNKQFKTAAIIVLVIVLLCVSTIVLLRSNFFYQNATAVKVNNTRYSIADYNYHRTLKINEYEGYFGELSSMGDLLSVDNINKATVNELAKITMYCEAAEKAGYELSEEMIADVEANMLAHQEYATIAELSFDEYLEKNYGKGVTAEVFKENALRTTLAKAYEKEVYNSIEYTAEELEAGYDADAKDVFGYYLYTFYNSTQKDGERSDEEAAAITKALAEEFASKVTDEKSFQELAVEYATGYHKFMYTRNAYATFTHNEGGSINDTYADWVIDASREKGDIEVFSDSVASYVVYYVDRNDNDYKPVSVRQIVYTVGTSYADYKEDADYEAAYLAAHDDVVAAANAAYEQWKEGEMTEESFAELADAYNANNITGAGGLMEIMIKDTHDKAIDDWCYDSSRKAGDVEVVVTPSGAYVMYYIGEYEQTYREYTSDREMRADDFDAWEAENLLNYVGEKGAFMGFGNKDM